MVVRVDRMARNPRWPASCSRSPSGALFVPANAASRRDADVLADGHPPAPAEALTVSPRVQFVDAARGVAVIGMLVANLLNVFLRRVPPLLTHNQGDVLRLFDLPAPVFQFLVGVSLTLFLRAREASGSTAWQARVGALRRFALLIFLGLVLDGVAAFRPVLRWGVLQTLGLGGMCAALLASVPEVPCIGLVLVSLGIFSGLGNGMVHVNPVAALAFAPLTVVGALFGRRLERPTAAGAAIAAIALGLAAVLFAIGVPFNKMLGTSSFVCLAAAVSAGTLAGAAWFEERGGTSPWWLLAVGRNALTTWVLLYALVYYPAWLSFPSWRRLPLWSGALAVVAVTVALCRITIACGRRGIRIPL
jgi:predicted acyltransferase